MQSHLGTIKEADGVAVAGVGGHDGDDHDDFGGGFDDGFDDDNDDGDFDDGDLAHGTHKHVTFQTGTRVFCCFVCICMRLCICVFM